MKKFLVVAVVAAFVVGVVWVAGDVFAEPSVPQPSVVDETVGDGECRPSSTSLCTPYAWSGYDRDCDPDYSLSVPAGCELEFHPSPNFCPRWLADGSVEYNSGNCRLKKWQRAA